jgi:hypothetical protein
MPSLDLRARIILNDTYRKLIQPGFHNDMKEKDDKKEDHHEKKALDGK